MGEPTLGDHLCEIGACSTLIGQLRNALEHWLQTPNNRVTASDGWVMATDSKFASFYPLVEDGVLIGYWDEAEMEEQQEARRQWLLRQ